MLISDDADAWSITYYNERVQREIYALPQGIRADYWRLIRLLETSGAKLRLPHSKSMGSGLFALRPHGDEGIGRVFYCMQVGRRIVMLHSFMKKTQRTPERELRIARKRMKEIRSNG
jgi:phage-related protein